MDRLSVRQGDDANIGTKARHVSPISHTLVFLALLSERCRQDAAYLYRINPPTIASSHHVQSEVLGPPEGRWGQARALVVICRHRDCFSSPTSPGRFLGNTVPRRDGAG